MVSKNLFDQFKIRMNIFRCLDDIRNGPSKSDKGEDVTQTRVGFHVPGPNPTFSQGNKRVAKSSLRGRTESEYIYT